MKVSTVGIIIVLAIVALALVFIKNMPTKVIPPSTTLPTTKPSTTIPITVTGEENILSDQINSLTEEQLAAISIDMTDFSTTTQNDIATDNSLFMYR